MTCEDKASCGSSLPCRQIVRGERDRGGLRERQAVGERARNGLRKRACVCVCVCVEE